MLLLLRRRTGAAFSPLSLAPALWLDASQLVLSDLDPVTTWPDTSGNGRDATQATAAKKPTYRTNIQNGLAVVRFDGVDDVLGCALPGFGLSDYSIVVVASGTTGVMFSQGQSASDTPLIMVSHFPPTTTRYNQRSDADVELPGGALDNGNTPDSAMRVRIIQRNGTTFLNRAHRVSASATATLGAMTTDLSTIGALGRTVVNSFLAGDIAELIAIPSAVSLSVLQQLESYVLAKWGA